MMVMGSLASWQTQTSRFPALETEETPVKGSVMNNTEERRKIQLMAGDVLSTAPQVLPTT